MDGQTGRCHFSRGLFQVSSAQVTALAHFSAVPLHYMSRVLATAMQQDEDVPATITASKPEGSLVPGPSSSPACPPRTLPLPIPPLLDIPFVGPPLVGCPFAEFLAVHTQRKWDHSPSGSLSDHHDKRTHVNSQEVKVRSEHSSAWGDEDMSKVVLEAQPSFNQQQGQEPTSSPLPVQPGPSLILMTALWQEV